MLTSSKGEWMKYIFRRKARSRNCKMTSITFIHTEELSFIVVWKKLVQVVNFNILNNFKKRGNIHKCFLHPKISSSTWNLNVNIYYNYSFKIDLLIIKKNRPYKVFHYFQYGYILLKNIVWLFSSENSHGKKVIHKHKQLS